jgi:beta-lactam-binding protein with PASTA domain/predicted Ser/Thr protein kinase
MSEVAENQLVDNRYRVIGRIGSGGMADVWCAEDNHLQRKVALKVLHHRFAQDQEFVERFRREAEAAAGLQHPNIVGVFDRGEVNGTYYIAMEYLEGRTLKELIDEGPTPAAALAIVRQILEGARFAHRHGVVHRDLKPQNVIVDAEGHATVTDFGIAHAGVSEITQTGSVMGTAHYLSPEQAQGLEVTPASDLYSIGVILYQALTGQVPFEGDSAVAVALKQVSQTPQRPSAINPAVSPALDAVVMRALAKDPEQRFADAEAFLVALDAAERDPASAPSGSTATFAPLPPVAAPPEAVAADGGPTPPRREDEEERHPWRWVLGAVLLGIIAGLILSQRGAPEATVPDVIGDEVAFAELELRGDGFEVQTETVHRLGPKDTVLEQDPPPGKADQDCDFLKLSCTKPTVTLTVNAGPGQAKVPRVAGLGQSEAEATLHNAHFAVGDIERSPSETVLEGVVISSDPSGGTLARQGSEVALTVSSGARKVAVPLVVGEPQAVAEAEIRSAGLVPSIQKRADPTAEGQVLQQAPDAGNRVAQGTTVTIIVSKGQAQVTIPNVIGKTRSSAVSTLRAKGFTVSVEEQETDIPSQDGRVVDQFPSPGSTAAKDSTVTIFVGAFTAPTPPPTTTTTPTTPTPRSG